MKPFLNVAYKYLATLFCFSMLSVSINAQNIEEDPGAYMTAISNAQMDMNKTYMAYMSAVAHSGRAKKIEKMRQKTLESIEKCRYKILDLPIYKKDNSLRQSSIDYVQMCYKVFNEDYAHIVNMEEIAEQSFDEMQAYLLLQEKTDEKLHEAGEKMGQASKDFAKKYNVTLIDSKSELYSKMEKASELTSYKNKLYLLFFKCNWQDGQITNAINQKKLNGVEQARNALATYAKEGLQVLDTLKPFAKDASLATACKRALNFYLKLAETDLPKVTDFFLKEENLEKVRKGFESKAESKRTQEDVDAYNKAVDEYNSAANYYNQLNNIINNGRAQTVESWNTVEQQFLDVHMPHYGS
ncbi:LIC11966 family surface protein [Foetidibacter luteolus]|uniref:LIC11966 family surface protein n=1 Tax=Foetidibacter luteolus TaxID=2608880 RepID=UPI00129ABB1C|nr:hypothetical protein [Foetidibacter luteolus]